MGDMMVEQSAIRLSMIEGWLDWKQKEVRKSTEKERLNLPEEFKTYHLNLNIGHVILCLPLLSDAAASHSGPLPPN